MSATSQTTNAAAVNAAMARVDITVGDLTLPDWQDHSAAIPTAVDSLTQLYLHVDALTGQHHPEAIYVDSARVVLGLMPKAIEPLVKHLEQQTLFVDLALMRGWVMPPAEEPAWKHWHDRLKRYRASLEAALASPTTPSEALWDEVTSPLLQGLYPEDFSELGIANPSKPSKPDMTTVPTTAFMVALQAEEVGSVQEWLLGWREGVANWRMEMQTALRGVFTKLEGAAAQTKRSLGWLGVGVAIGVIGVGAWVLSRD